MHLAGFAQTLGGGFGSDVALRHAEHFKTNHEFAHCGRAQQRRIEVGVEMPLLVSALVRRRLVETHGVGEAGFEEIVEARGDAAKRIGQAVALVGRELRHGAQVAAADQQHLEGPDCPPGDEGGEVVVLEDQAATMRGVGAIGGGGIFGGEIFAKEAAAGEGEVLALGFGFGCGLFGDEAGGPDLAVWMGVAGAHHRAAVLEDLHVLDPVVGAQLLVLAHPGVDDGADLFAGHAGQGERVVGVVAEDLAEAACRHGAEKLRGLRSGRRGRIGQESGVIVYKGEHAVVGRIDRTAGTVVAGAEVAFRIVGDAGRRGFLAHFALPRPLRAMGRNQHPRLPQRIPAPVR